MVNPYTERLKAQYEDLRKGLLREDVTYEQFIEACKKPGSELYPFADHGVLAAEPIFEGGRQQGRKEMIEEIPWKRTVIGPERSMPPKTEIWFVTSDEVEQLRKIQQ